MDRENKLVKLARRVSGKQLYDPTAVKIMGQVDWWGYYPVVNRAMEFTGEVVDSQADGFANVDDEAVISFDELTHREREIAIESGYFSPLPNGGVPI